MELRCTVCSLPFEAKSKLARYCSAKCRQRARRMRTSGVAGDGGEGLVASVTRELESAGRLDTFHGQLAVQLARQVTSAGATGISGLSKELRTVMAQALDGAPARPTSSGADDEGDSDDEVARLRRQREKARQEAGLA